MKSLPTLVHLLLVVALVSSLCSNCEQLSTVFVLETSDSDPQPLVSHDYESSSPKKKSVDPNTHIITDESPFSSTSTPSSTTDKLQRLQTTEQQQSNNSIVTKVPRDSYTSNNNQRDSATNTSSGINRKIEEESPPVAPTRQKASSVVRTSTPRPPQPVSTGAPARTRTTTTTSSYDKDADSSNSSKQQQHAKVPVTEERLLISITSGDDDDDNYKPPKKQVVSNGETISVISSHDGDQIKQPQQQKRKPSITISIQEANPNKQNGGSGPSAVIVRPSENGQHIVISTVGASQLNENSFNQNKPIIISTSNHNEHNNNDQPYKPEQPHKPEQPYREPVEDNHEQHIVSQHQQVTTSTHRPPPMNDYNPQPSRPINDYSQNVQNQNSRPINNPQDYNPTGQSSRPITSTLIDQPRPPVQVDEPQRPPKQVETEEPIYEPPPQPQPQRPTSRPIVKPTSTPPPEQPSNFNSENDDTIRPITNIQQQQQQQQSAEPKYPLNEKSCGLVHETRIVGGEEADPEDNLWMAAIIKSKPVSGEVRPFCGGSLITRRHILTAAHCLEGLAPRDVLVRLGSYDFDDATASSLSADFAIDQFRVPAQYSKKTHMADLAIMRLKTPLTTTDNYRTVCMPQPRRSYVGTLGTVTGYGSQSQTFRRAAPKLRQVTVPIWENRKCSVVYKKNMTESFLCAGFEDGGKDACQGDSGGPLVVEGPNERMMVVGVVSHGIGCGSPGYPGVYSRVTSFIDWIEKNTKE